MNRSIPRKLILENGAEFSGYSFGSIKDTILEIVFNTSMTGYQEILSDPSYTGQAVVMTYPLIGNYGMTEDDYEADLPSIGAMIVHEYNDRENLPAREKEEPADDYYRNRQSLDAVMKRFDIPGISGVDTRRLTRLIWDFGSCKVLLTGLDTAREKGLQLLKTHVLPTDAVSRVSTGQTGYYPSADPAYHVAVIDCGIKKNIIRSLNARRCSVTLVPWNTTAARIRALHPDGVLISNGPGDPADIPETVETIRAVKGTFPVFGICLGHQLIARAYGAETYKLKFGHRGGNHPVRCLETGRIEITSQNHSYAVDENSLTGTGLRVTHINLLDGTVEGLSCGKDRLFSVQYHPESAPGPEDSSLLFDRFVRMMEVNKANA